MYSWHEFEQIGLKCGLVKTQMNELAPFYRTLDAKQFDQWSELLGQWKLEEKKLAEIYQQREQRQLQLLLILSLYPSGYEKFKKLGWPITIFDNTIEDMAIWVRHHEENFDYPGLDWRLVCWLNSILHAQTIRLGRLQCNIKSNFEGKISVCRNRYNGELKYPCETSDDAWECVLKHGDPVINLHIPASGPLVINDCKESIKSMLAFFRQYLPETNIKAVVCYSWLFDRQLQHILKPTSNILAFQQIGHLFDFVEEGDNHLETIWRVFGEKGRREGVNAVPHFSDMQRRMAEFVNNGGRFSSGGIFILPEEIDAWEI